MTTIYDGAVVCRGAVLGDDCSIAPGACVDGAVLGDRVRVQVNALIPPGIKIGDDVFIGPNVTLCNDAWPRTHKKGYDEDLPTSGKFVIIIENGASIGANTVVLPGVKIGKRAMIAAGSRVTRSVPADHLFLHGEVQPITHHPRRMRYVR